MADQSKTIQSIERRVEFKTADRQYLMNLCHSPAIRPKEVFIFFVAPSYADSFLSLEKKEFLVPCMQ